MIQPKEIISQIDRLTGCLIENSFSCDQNFSSINNYSEGFTTISWSGEANISETFNNDLSYKEIYDICRDRRYFTLLLVDEAIIQFYYNFKNGVLMNHRIAFLPSPYLEEFQNHPELYIDDLIYAEVINKSLVPSPIRFDYDKKSFEDTIHPQSHMTIGQYQNCRIPVRSALTPFQFINFIFNNFYNNVLCKTELYDKCNEIYFGSSITPSESNLVHMNFEA